MDVQKVARGQAIGCRHSSMRERSPPGTECEIRITVEPEVDVQAERPQVKPILVVSFRARCKDIAQRGCTP